MITCFNFHSESGFGIGMGVAGLFGFGGVVREFKGLCLVGGGGGIISGVTVVGFFWGW